MTLLQSFGRSLPAAGHLSALVLGSSTCQVPSLLQPAGYGSSSMCCCSWPLTRQSSSCSGVGHTAAGGDIISNNSGNSSEPSMLSSTTCQFQQACIGAVSPGMHLQLQQRQSSLTKQTVSWAHAPQRHRGKWDAHAAGTLVPSCRVSIQCQAAAAGPGAAMPLLQLRRLVLLFGFFLKQLQPWQLGVWGLSRRTVDRWQPGGRSNRQRPGGRQHHVPLGQLCAQAESLQELQQLLQQHVEHINGIAVAAAYTRAGKLCQRDSALVQSAAARELLQHLDQLLPSVCAQLGPRELSNIIWSCAYTQHTGPVAPLLADFMQPKILSAANCHDVANVLRTLAILKWQVPQQQLGQLAAAVAGQADKATPQQISNSVWALGKLGYQMLQQQLTVLLAAFTTEGMLARANTQNIANLLLGMAYLGQQVPAAQLQLLLAAFVSKRSGAKAQEIGNLLWAVSGMRQQVQTEHLGQLQAAFVQQLELLLAALVEQLHRAMPQDISNTLLACTRFRYVPVQLLVALQQQEHMQRFLAAANLQDVANAALGWGMLGHNSDLLLVHLLQQGVKLLQQDSSRFVFQDPCHLCWAAAVLDLHQYVPEVLQLAQASSSVWDSAAPEGLQQLYQVHLWLRDHNLVPAEGANGQGLLRVLSQQQLDGCRQAWQDQVASNATLTPSLMQQQVFEALEQLLGWHDPPQQEKLTDDDSFSIDIVAVTAAGVRLAVEVDGPSHFVSPGDRVNGPTQYRDRALKARGYTVVSIPGWEWEQLKGTEQRQQYLLEKLKGA